MRATEILKILNQKIREEDKEDEKSSGKFTITLPNKSTKDVDTLADAASAVKDASGKGSVEVIRNSDKKKIAYGPKAIAANVLLSLSNKEK